MKDIFDPKALAKKMLSFDEYKPFLCVNGGKNQFPSTDSEIGKSIIANGEEALNYEIDPLPLSKYRMFVDNGDRIGYETPYFSRRAALMKLIYAELCERNGRFIKKMMDILYAICEESTWVIPAHNYSVKNHFSASHSPISESPMEDVWFVDLFAATTGADVAVAYYFFRDEFEKEIPGYFNARLLHELQRRIIKPYLSYIDYWWMGYMHNDINNWNPWINQNILTTAIYAVHDDETRKALARKTAESINFYINTLPSDGGCDEGPSYWGAAGSCVYMFAEMCYDMTGGECSVFDNPDLIKIVKYILKVNITDNYFFNCADAAPKTNPDAAALRRFGRLSGDETIRGFGCMGMKKNNKTLESLNGSRFPDRYIRNLAEMCLDDEDIPYTAPKAMILENLEIAALRESSDTSNGFYIGMKGGHNAENHNHLDVGNVIIYCDGKPLIIDMGVGTYTKFTFRADTRYTLAGMSAKHHNLPLINGKGQGVGKDFAAKDFFFDPENGIICADIAAAYENRDEIVSMKRTASLRDGKITLSDSIKLENEGEAELHLMLPDLPEKISDGRYLLSQSSVISFGEDAIVSVEELPLDDEKFINTLSRDKLYIMIIKKHGKSREINLVSEITHQN